MYKHILVPIAPEHSPLTGDALDVAKTLLDKDGRITALTVIEDIPSYISQYLPPGQMETNRAEAEAALKADLGGAKGVHVTAVIGHAAASILDFAETHGVDCIVIASHRPSIQDYFLGSTAARVVRHAKCSVHVLR